MIPPGNNSPFSFHLAGIIPVHAQEISLNVPWPPCLTPIDDGYSLIQRSIIECAYAGCETIWVVCNNDMAPIVKHQVGDYIHDPLYYYRGKSPRPTEEQKMIPIFYTPIHPNDRNKRDSLGWAVLHGAYTSYLISKQLSKWVIPNKYYVSFPYGVYEPSVVSKHRKSISSKDNFVLTYKDKTVQDNKYLGFSFGSEDFVSCRKYVRSHGTLLYSGVLNEKNLPSEKLDKQDRYSGKYFDLSQVFHELDTSNATIIEVDKYNRILDWQDYRDFMKEEEYVSKPKSKWFVKNLYKKSTLYPEIFE